MVVLDTSEGRELKKLIEGGVRLGVSTRALGGVKPSRQLGEGVVEVLPGLRMKQLMLFSILLLEMMEDQVS